MDTENKAVKRRFASIVNLAVDARATFVRFPFAILCAIGAAAAAHYLVGVDFEETDAMLPVFFTCMLGISVFFSLRMLTADRDWSRTDKIGVTLAGLAVLVIFYVTRSSPLRGADYFQFLLLMAATHLFASFAPFIARRGEENGFWQYNGALLSRGALAAVYSGVLYIGLALALAAVDSLLGVDVEGETYGKLWFWIAFVYTAWFFMAGTPKDVRGLNEVKDYPVALRVFTQYVLIPLVAIYMLILYAYLVKIIVEWELPTGWVTYPVIGVSITGVLALLLIYPLREQAENVWIKSYSRYFFWTLYPLIGLVVMAIWIRVSEYGVTEKRYLVVAATAWLLGIALYFTFKRVRDIRIIPLSLCIVSLLAAFGPWGGGAISKRSQLGRLTDLLVAHEVMTGAGLTDESKSVEFEPEQEISSIVGYLDEMHGLEVIRGWYARPEDLPEEFTPQVAMEEMGLKYRGRWESAEDVSLTIAAPQPLTVFGFDYAYLLNEYFGSDSVDFHFNLDSLTRLTLRGTTLSVGSRAGDADVLSADLADLILDLDARRRQGETLEANDASHAAENASYRLMVYVTSVGGNIEGDSLKLNHLAATILVGTNP